MPNQPNHTPKPKTAQTLFWLGMAFYLLTRLIALDKFPIYFFSDEAIQTMSAFDLINRGFRDVQGNFFPVYFENGQQFNLSLSVWLQVLIAWLPRSVWLTRGLPALISLVFLLNPLEIVIDFAEPIELSNLTALVGSPATRLIAAIRLFESGCELVFVENVASADVVRPVRIDLGENYKIVELPVWVASLGESEPTHVHLWELILE